MAPPDTDDIINYQYIRASLDFILQAEHPAERQEILATLDNALASDIDYLVLKDDLEIESLQND